MVELRVGAVLKGSDSAALHLPVVVGSDSDGHGALGDGCSECAVSGFDVLVAGDVQLSLGSVLLAGAVGSGVRLVGLKHELVGLEVGECVVHEAAIAALVLVCVTVDQLLLSELQEGAGGDGVSGLD